MHTETSPPVTLPSITTPSDWFLQSLVLMVNTYDFEFGITLQVSGLLVSGNLVGGKKYFEGFAEDFSSNFSNDLEAAKNIKDSFTQYGEIYEKKEDGEIPPPQYIHLRDTRFFNTTGQPIPRNKGVWWRGRVSEVGGFMLGSLSSVG